MVYQINDFIFHVSKTVWNQSKFIANQNPDKALLNINTKLNDASTTAQSYATVTKVRPNDNFVRISLFFHCLPELPLSEKRSYGVRSSS